MRPAPGQLALVACAVLAACGSAPSREAGRARENVRPIDELPERQREVWTAWLRDDPGWPARREELAADPALADFVVDNLVRTMLHAFGRGEIATLEDRRLGPFERARAELIVLAERSTPVLVQLLAVGNDAAAELAASLLVEIGRPALDPLAALLADRSETTRARAADLLGRMPPAVEGEEDIERRLAERVAGDPLWLVRARAAASLAQRASRSRTTALARRTLERALRDEDVAVRREAAAGLGRLGDPVSVPALIEHLGRSMDAADLENAVAAQSSLQTLTGRRGELDPLAWRELWRRQRSAPR